MTLTNNNALDLIKDAWLKFTLLNITFINQLFVKQKYLRVTSFYESLMIIIS